MSELSFWHFFTDPILRGPMLGVILMSLSSSLIGVIVFIKRRSLLGEALSHASYPGVVFAALIAAIFFEPSSLGTTLLILIGAFVFSLIGLFCIEKLEKGYKIKPDAALSLILALFLGLGVTLSSKLQMTHPVWVQQVQLFLCGQAATMTDTHIGIYAALAVCTLLFVILRFRQIEFVHFDPGFSRSVGLSSKVFNLLSFLLMILILVVGIRSVGVILMAGMLIAPAVFARQMSRRLAAMFIWSGAIGMLSGFLGVFLSVKIPLLLDESHPVSLPTGPMIVLVAALFAFLGLLLSPRTGTIARWVRVRRFRLQQHGDHLLKILWKEEGTRREALKNKMGVSELRLAGLLAHLRRGGWVQRGSLGLSPDGRRRAAQLIRLHRLWELYLTSELNVAEDRVHASAEEMEHILTPEIERALTELLKNPKQDPHHQPIPKRGDPLCTQ